MLKLTGLLVATQYSISISLMLSGLLMTLDNYLNDIILSLLLANLLANLSKGFKYIIVILMLALLVLGFYYMI